MEQLTCFFHPNRKANKKCTRCGKFLCLECQKTVRSICVKLYGLHMIEDKI